MLDWSELGFYICGEDTAIISEIENKYYLYEISQMVGYTNVDYFHKKFKKYVGMSPAEFRKANSV